MSLSINLILCELLRQVCSCCCCWGGGEEEEERENIGEKRESETERERDREIRSAEEGELLADFV